MISTLLTLAVGAGTVGGVAWTASASTTDNAQDRVLQPNTVPTSQVSGSDASAQLPPILPAQSPSEQKADPAASRIATTAMATTSESAEAASPTAMSTPAKSQGRAAPATSPADSSFQGKTLQLVNDIRADAGCSPVSVDERLTQSASAHSADMSARNYFSHSSPEGESFANRASQAGYPSPGAENIAQGYSNAEAAMDGWMKSEGHRKNILNCSLTTMGVGVEANGWYWTQDFGR